MIIALDASVLMLVIRPESPTRPDPATGKPVTHIPERIQHFIEQLEKHKTTILVPTPALSEVLILSGISAPETVAQFQYSRVFQIAPFDTRAAVELAAMGSAMKGQKRKAKGSESTWAKLKFDYQILAISRVGGASVVYSDDDNFRKAASTWGINCRGLADLELPDFLLQSTLHLPENTDQ